MNKKNLRFHLIFTLDRISTKINLARINVLPWDASLNCDFCGRDEESSAYIFLHCHEGVGKGVSVVHF